jgi:hypothetical protein
VEIGAKHGSIMKKEFILTLTVCLFSTSLLAQDLSEKLVGTWLLTCTNVYDDRPDTWMNTETKYDADGTFTMKGEVGSIEKPLGPPGTRKYAKRDGVWVPDNEMIKRKLISGSGTWRIDGGYLHFALTNSTSMRTNKGRYQIVSISGEQFAYRAVSRNSPSNEIPVLTAFRKH